MKKYAVILFASLFMASGLAEEKKETKEEPPKTKRVCIKKTDPKTKEEKETCKNVKVHKKLEGTKVPEKK